MSRQWWLAGLVLALASLFGCGGSGPRTYPVSGEVSFDGTPVAEGDILFIPADPAVAPEGGKITNGRYQLRAKPGWQRVEIRASRPLPGPPGPMGPVYADYIPEEFNSKSTLKAEVSPGGKNLFNFPLQSRAAGKPGPKS
jgi:hypothetical protein